MFLQLKAWQTRGCQKATIACKSRRTNRLKVLQTICTASKAVQAEDNLRGKQGLLIFKILHFFGCLSSTTASPFDLFYSSVFLTWDFRLSLNSTHRLQGGRSTYASKIHLFPVRLPSCHPYPAALHNSGPGLQISHAHLANLLCQTVCQLWGLQPQVHYERQPSKVMGCWKLCYKPKQRIFLLSFPTHYSCQSQGFSGSPQNTQIIGSCYEPRLKTSLHLKKVEGEEQGRGEGTFASGLVLKRGLAVYACALPCNLEAPQDRTPRSILYWTLYTPHSKRTTGSLHPFQSAQLLLNQHCQKARQHYNKLAPLTICWSCCSIVCLFKTRARAHTHKPTSKACSLLPSPKLQTCSLRERGKQRLWIKPMQSNSHCTGTLPGFCSFTTSKTKECPHCSSLEDQGVEILISALD